MYYVYEHILDGKTIYVGYGNKHRPYQFTNRHPEYMKLIKR